MREFFILFVHLLVKIAQLMKPGGARAIVAENLLLKQQLLLACRSRQRAPRLSTLDRLLFGWLGIPQHSAYGQGRCPPQAFYTASISRGAGPTQVPSAVHATHSDETGSQRALPATDPHHRRDETAQPPLRLPANRSADCLYLWDRDR